MLTTLAPALSPEAAVVEDPENVEADVSARQDPEHPRRVVERRDRSRDVSAVTTAVTRPRSSDL
jgi:hypothetical protein